MGITVTATDTVCRVAFEGDITYDYARTLEDQIIDTLRRYQHLAIDLSAIREIDLCGLHLLAVLSSVGGANAVIVADSPVVQQATQRLLQSYRGVALRGSRSERSECRAGGNRAEAGAAQLSL